MKYLQPEQQLDKRQARVKKTGSQFTDKEDSDGDYQYRQDELHQQIAATSKFPAVGEAGYGESWHGHGFNSVVITHGEDRHFGDEDGGQHAQSQAWTVFRDVPGIKPAIGSYKLSLIHI